MYLVFTMYFNGSMQKVAYSQGFCESNASSETIQVGKTSHPETEMHSIPLVTPYCRVVKKVIMSCG